MIYLSGNQNIQNHWIPIVSGNNALNVLNNYTDIFDHTIKNGDIFAISLEYFSNIDDILSFLTSLPQNLNVIILKDQLNLVEGTILIKKGVKSYCYTYADEIILDRVIKTVEVGDTWVYPALMNYIIKQINIKPTGTVNVLDKLTDKEKYVALLVASGDSNKEIAKSLNVALVTVKKHISSIFEKLKIRDRVSLSILVNS